MIVNPRRPLFNRRPQNNIYRTFMWAVLILVGVWIIYGSEKGEIKPVGLPTATATRTAESYATEGDTHFDTGKLEAAIQAYRNALQVDPNNAQVWAKLARIQTYSSLLLTTDDAKRQRLAEALDSANQAKTLAPDDSTVAAIRSFVLDWNANPFLNPDQTEAYLTEAEQEAVRARQLDNTNTLALVFYSEIMIDEQKFTQAEQYITQALSSGEDFMDLHRVYAALLESYGLYNQAIQEYDKAIALAPNLTFLYLRAGANYRTLGYKSLIENPDQDPIKNELLIKSLEYFDKAAKINEQLGVKDPQPYLSISKTYSQMGQFFIAGRNVLKALSFKPDDADVYGQLGIVFFKSRNYEGSIPALKCAIRGCTAEESCDARGGCDEGEIGVEVKGQALSQSTVVYYYTYGSVLAALSRPKDNKCGEAMQVFSEIRAKFSEDTTIMGIVQSGETICNSLAARGSSTSATVTPVDSTALTPAATGETPTPTLTVTPAPQVTP